MKLVQMQIIERVQQMLNDLPREEVQLVSRKLLLLKRLVELITVSSEQGVSGLGVEHPDGKDVGSFPLREQDDAPFIGPLCSHSHASKHVSDNYGGVLTTCLLEGNRAGYKAEMAAPSFENADKVFDVGP